MSDITKSIIQKHLNQSKKLGNAADYLQQFGSLQADGSAVDFTGTASNPYGLISQGLNNLVSVAYAPEKRANAARAEQMAAEQVQYERGQDALQMAFKQQQADREDARLKLDRDRLNADNFEALADTQSAQLLQQQLGTLNEYTGMDKVMESNRKGWESLYNQDALEVGETGNFQLKKGATEKQVALFNSVNQDMTTDITGSRLTDAAQRLVAAAANDKNPYTNYTLESAKTAIRNGLQTAVSNAAQLGNQQQAEHEATIAQLGREETLANDTYAAEILNGENWKTATPEQRRTMVANAGAQVAQMSDYRDLQAKVGGSPEVFQAELQKLSPVTLDEADMTEVMDSVRGLVDKHTLALKDKFKGQPLETYLKSLDMNSPEVHVAMYRAIQQKGLDTTFWQKFLNDDLKDGTGPLFEQELMNAVRLNLIDQGTSRNKSKFDKLRTAQNYKRLTQTGLSTSNGK